MPPESAYERIGWMLQQVSRELEPWISARDGWPADLSPKRRSDPYVQFKVLRDEWHRTFRNHLDQIAKTYIFELSDVRNAWAHHQTLTDDDAWRAFDTAERLMRSTGASETANNLATAKRKYSGGPVSPDKKNPAPERDTAERLSTKPAGGPSIQRSAEPVERSAVEAAVDKLPTNVVQPARRVLNDLVERAGGTPGRTSIPIDFVDALGDLFDAWADYHGHVEPGGVLVFGPQPGLWHALQGLAPIEDPNRWDSLRKAVVQHLEAHRGWVRETPPRGSRFRITRS